jgi:hypothetical protein
MNGVNNMGALDDSLSVSTHRASRFTRQIATFAIDLALLASLSALAGWIRFHGPATQQNPELLVRAWESFANNEPMFDAMVLFGGLLSMGLIIAGRRAVHRLRCLPEERLAPLAGQLEVKDRITLENDLRAHRLQIVTTIVQSVGAVVLIVGIYFTWASLKTTQDAQRNTLTSAEQGQVTERFIRAVDQLGARDTDGKPIIEIRVAGIWGLGRIAQESPKDYDEVIDILNAYVEANARWQGTRYERSKASVAVQSLPLEHQVYSAGEIAPQADIEAALKFIAYYQTYQSDRAESHTADLDNTDLIGAVLDWAHLKNGDLKGAHLEGAHLTHAYLQGAHLEGAHMAAADLESADLRDAHLNHADLGTVKHLTQQQIEVAEGDPKTRLPTAITTPKHWNSKVRMEQ